MTSKAGEWEKTPKGRLRRQKRNRKYNTGFTDDLFRACLEHQGHRCAICTVPLVEGTWQADHHEPEGVKVPRGVLCRSCNLSLGHYEKHQRRNGLVLPPYDEYIDRTPVMAVLSKHLDGGC